MTSTTSGPHTQTVQTSPVQSASAPASASYSLCAFVFRIQMSTRLSQRPTNAEQRQVMDEQALQYRPHEHRVHLRRICRNDNYPVPYTSGARDGVLFSIDFFVSLFVCLFIYIFVSLLARLRENGWSDLHETFREGVEWPWDDLITFLVNSEKPRDAQHGDGVCCAFAPQLVI